MENVFDSSSTITDDKGMKWETNYRKAFAEAVDLLRKGGNADSVLSSLQASYKLQPGEWQTIATWLSEAANIERIKNPVNKAVGLQNQNDAEQNKVLYDQNYN